MWQPLTVLLVLLFFSPYLLLGDDTLPLNKVPPKGEGSSGRIPNIPELSTRIKDPAVWKNGTRLLFFYTPWCSYSQSFRPLLYGLIEQIYHHNISSIFIGQIDVSVNSDVARTFRIKATPTLLLFQNGTRYEFNDDVSLVNLVKFVLKIMGPSVIQVNSTTEVREYQKQHSVVFLLIHDLEVHEDWQLMYERVSRERILIGHFLYTTNPTIIDELGFKLLSLPSIVVLKDGQMFHYKEALVKYRLTLWVESEQFPALPTVNATNMRAFTNTGAVKRLVLLVVSKEESRSIPQKKAYEAVRHISTGRKLHSGYQFIIVEDVELIERIFGISFLPPSLIVWEHHTGHYFVYESNFYSEKEVSSFLYAVTAGKIQAQGGPSVFSKLHHWYWWLYNLIHIMVSHRPFLSLIALILMVSGFIICMYTRLKRPHHQINPSKRREAIMRARARQRENERRKRSREAEERKKEQEEEEEESERESGSESDNAQEDKKDK